MSSHIYTSVCARCGKVMRSYRPFTRPEICADCADSLVARQEEERIIRAHLHEIPCCTPEGMESIYTAYIERANGQARKFGGFSFRSALRLKRLCKGMPTCQYELDGGIQVIEFGY